jgi:hypothetical protein
MAEPAAVLKRIAQLQATGKTLSQIATCLRTTKGALAGVIYRARHPTPKRTPKRVRLREHAKREERKHAPKPKPIKTGPVMSNFAPEPPPSVTPPVCVRRGVPLVELPPHACKYAVGEDENGAHLFCATPTAGGPYCSQHSVCAHAERPARPIRPSRGW